MNYNEQRYLDDPVFHRLVDMTEELPPPHTHVWCYNRDGVQFEGCICYRMHKPFFTYPRGDGNSSNTAPAWIDVTHWMSLPPPPAEGSGT